MNIIATLYFLEEIVRNSSRIPWKSGGGIRATSLREFHTADKQRWLHSLSKLTSLLDEGLDLVVDGAVHLDAVAPRERGVLSTYEGETGFYAGN